MKDYEVIYRTYYKIAPDHEAEVRIKVKGTYRAVNMWLKRYEESPIAWDFELLKS